MLALVQFGSMHWGVRHRTVNQRVYLAPLSSGSYAEQDLYRELETHPLPDGISFSQGAATGGCCSGASCGDGEQHSG
jgi:hypothetical protein